MNSCSKHSIRSYWRSTISGTVACVSCWSAVPSATAQQPESSSLMTYLSVSPITAASIRSKISERTDHQAPAERELQSILMPQRKLTDTEVWERFEAEYSPPQKSPSLIKRQIETAKYGLDTAVFALDRFTKNVENQADFSFDQGSLRRTRAISLGASRSSPRVKLDLDMWQGSRPYVGVRLIIPFGN
ncbi:MAG: hypothetical protein ABSG14_01820 [Verrucomicrobiia bacterium]